MREWRLWVIVDTLAQYGICASGGMVDALASGVSVRKDMEVRVFSRVPNKIAAIKPLFFTVKCQCRGSVTTIVHHNNSLHGRQLTSTWI